MNTCTSYKTLAEYEQTNKQTRPLSKNNIPTVLRKGSESHRLPLFPSLAVLLPVSKIFNNIFDNQLCVDPEHRRPPVRSP